MPRTLEIQTRLSRVEHWRHLIELIAIIGAGLWALVFVYQEKIKPNLDPPELQGTVSVEHWNLPDNRELIKTIQLTKNTGVTPLRVGAISAAGQKLRGNLDGFWLFRYLTDSALVRSFPHISSRLADLGQPEK